MSERCTRFSCLPQVYRNSINPYVPDGTRVVRGNFRHGQMVHVPAVDSHVILGTVPVPLQYSPEVSSSQVGQRMKGSQR